MIKRTVYAVIPTIIIIICSIMCFAQVNRSNAQTQTVYARVLTESTAFYSDPDCNIVKFNLPYSYFVKVLSIGEDSTRVVYMDGDVKIPSREGYIKTCDLFIAAEEPQSPYPTVKLTLKTDEVLFADSKKETPKAVLSSGEQAAYYGQYSISGELFYYVYCGGYVGYVRASGFVSAEIPRHLLPINPSSSSDSTAAPVSYKESQTQGEKLDYSVRTIVIIAVALVAISVVWLLFRPQNVRSQFALTERDDNDD